MSINAKLEASESQMLRFVNKTQQNIDVAACKFDFTKMIYADYFVFTDVKDLVYIPYATKIQAGDDTFIQFKTSYPSFILTLVKVNPYTETEYNGMETLKTSYTDIEGDTIYVYNIPIEDTDLLGEYYFKIKGYSANLAIQDFWSEPFEVAESFPETLVIKFGGNSPFDDGMVWSNTDYAIDEYQQLRIEATLLSPSFTTGATTYEDSDSELTILKAYPTATHVLEIAKIPWYIYEKLVLALGHDEFLINDVLYQTAEDFELTDLKSQLAFMGSIPLRKVEYQNKTVMETLTGDIPVFEDSFSLINDTDFSIINDSDNLNKINN